MEKDLNMDILVLENDVIQQIQNIVFYYYYLLEFITQFIKLMW